MKSLKIYFDNGLSKEEFEDPKGVIRSRKSGKDRQHNWQ